MDGLIKLMEDYYANENYESCLDTCFEIIKNSTQISTEIFGRIGLCFGKTRRYEEALEYAKAEGCNIENI